MSRKEAIATYCIRVDEVETTAEALASYADRECVVRLLAVRHNGSLEENQHMHMCITFDPPQPIDTVRAYFKRHFNVKGNKEYSIKKWDGDTKALSYMFHEGSDICANKGYTTDDIDQFKKQDTEVKQKIKKDKETSIQGTIISSVKTMLEAGDVVNEKVILHMIITQLKKKDKTYYGDWRIKNMVETVKMYTNDQTQFEDEVYERLYGRFVR